MHVGHGQHGVGIAADLVGFGQPARVLGLITSAGSLGPQERLRLPF
ncbi:hypothetical protein OOZ63_22975 [Paucibacter sp. PLA-PC-4]|nr:hypothetical protein [Paucibacter sp. PLA-PC-4]MCX2864700.1 hypothetical protein [Paucibacter sp. PLA-PC-4]